MCTRCGCQDREICELCGGESNKVAISWSTREVQLDVDHQGELVVKLQEVIKEGANKTKHNLELLTRVTENKATNADLEYIDCL